jgi:hypothetical protein
MQLYTSKLAVTAVLLLAAAWPAAADDANPARPNPAASDLSISRFYSGAVTQVGTFPGKLVCLRCDLAPGPGAAKACATSGHRHALAAANGSAIYPLVTGDKAVLDRINSNELHDKNVVVKGILYPSTGIIFVYSVTPAA